MKRSLLSQINKLLLFIWVLALFCGLQAAEAATTTYNIFERIYEPMTQPNDSIFVGTFDYDGTTHTVTNLRGRLSESMTGGATGYPGDSMTWLTLNNQLVSWHDATLGGTFAAVFKNTDTNTFWTNGGTLDGWSPQAGIDAGGVYYGFPTNTTGIANPGNAYALIFVPDNPLDPLTQAQIDKVAYADCAPGGMMMAACMTGTSLSGYGAAGTMDGYPAEQVITVVDTAPDTFSFTPVTGAATAFATTSNAITVTGITGAATISISGGTSPKYSVSTDGGTTWSTFSASSPATVLNGNQVKVQVTSSTASFTATSTTLNIGGIAGSFSVTTGYLNPPSWMPMTMLSVGYDSGTGALTVQDESNKLGAGVYPVMTYIPAGVYDPAKPWSVINGGVALSRQLGWDDPTAPHGNGIHVTGTLVTTIASTYGPDAGIWIERISQSPGLETYFADGMYGVGGTGNAASGTPQVYTDPNGFPIIYANNYSGIFGTNGSSTKWKWNGTMIHNVYAVPAAYLTQPNQLFTATYRVYVGDSTGNDIAPSAATTEVWTWKGPATVPDTTPNAFSFTSQGPVALNTVIESNAITVSGIDATALISITGGEYSVSTDGSTWSAYSATTPATIANGNQVKLRQTSAATQGTTTTATLTIGGVAGNFSVTTVDTTPDAFSFTPVTGADAGTNIDSGIITVTGINTPAAISIVGGKYAISTDNGGSWSAWVTTAGTVANNNQVKVQVAASALANTAVTATLTIGGVSGGFTATTNGYAAPPTWMPMTMLNITLSSGQLAIVAESTKSPFSGTPATTWPALSTVTQAGIFDPAKPWALLTGTAYSRRLGWNPGAGLNAAAVQSTFGSNASIWIERTGGSAGFGTYQAVGKYGVNADGTATVDVNAHGYTPIFGTAGSSTKWQWDYMMDHNANAVPAAYITTPNQLFTATYRLYIGDSAGNDIAPAAAATTTWTWQGPATVPDTTPDAFSFTSQGPVAPSTIVESDAITVSGIDSTALISITGGEYAVSTDGGTNWSTYSSTIPATVAVGNQVKVRQTSSASQGATTIAALTIGGVTGNFNVTTVQVFTISATSGSNGSITPSGNVLVEQNKDQTFDILPNSGFVIHDVIVDGSTVGTVASHTFTHVVADHTIMATFIAHHAKNARTGMTYSNVQEAYNAAGDGDEILLHSGTIDGPLVAERADINVTLTGGYDSGFTSGTGTTAIQGKLSIRNGSVHVRKVRLY